MNTNTPAGWNATWLAVGRVSTLAALVLFIGLQQINHDYFPPNVSISRWLLQQWHGGTIHGKWA